MSTIDLANIYQAMQFDIIWNYRELFLRGISLTVRLTLLGYGLGLILGIILGLGRLSKRQIFSYPSKIYIGFFRGTPLLVQLLIIHVAVIPTIFGQSLGYFVSGALALTLNSAAYIAEIVRAGIESLDKGQSEAARSLGMPEGMAMRFVILPQAIRRMVPPLGNELIALLKDSSLVTMIAATDILYAAKVVQGATFRVWEPYLTAAALYLILTWILTRVITYIENRFSTSYVPKNRTGEFFNMFRR